jgi:hypothetical protein
MKSLTGIEFEAAPGQSFPVAAVNDAQGTVHNNSTSHFYDSRTFDVTRIRDLARQAGVHVFVDDDHEDVLYANESLIVLHSGSSGRRTLRLPQKCDVTDLVSGKTWHAADRVALEVAEFETRLLHWMPSS